MCHQDLAWLHSHRCARVFKYKEPKNRNDFWLADMVTKPSLVHHSHSLVSLLFFTNKTYICLMLAATKYIITYPIKNTKPDKLLLHWATLVVCTHRLASQAIQATPMSSLAGNITDLVALEIITFNRCCKYCLVLECHREYVCQCIYTFPITAHITYEDSRENSWDINLKYHQNKNHYSDKTSFSYFCLIFQISLFSDMSTNWNGPCKLATHPYESLQHRMGGRHTRPHQTHGCWLVA